LPTFNESSIIKKKLEDLFSLDYPLDKIELVVIDSSTDETPTIISSFFKNIKTTQLILIKESKRRGLAVALNEAYAAATHDIVIKTDCDSLLDPSCLKEAVSHFSDRSVGAVTGTNMEVIGGSKVESGYRNVQSYIQLLESHLDSTFIFHGPFSAFRKKCIVPVTENSLADDTELALNIRRQNFKVLFDPNIKFKEAAHSAFWKRRLQKDRRAVGLVKVLLQNKDLLGKSGLYGSFILPFNWWFLILSPWFVLLSIFSILLTIFLASPVSAMVVLLALLISMWLGQKDSLRPFQIFYSLFDTQVSLLRSHLILLTKKDTDGTWDADPNLREMMQ
jgi:cellulose synthase/poly-beta-1,6-N-acetylglucosamine synthase-like glycosyltransferase